MKKLSFQYEIEEEFYSEMARCLLNEDFDNIELVIHARPDGDTIGSAYALAYILLKYGKNVKVVSYDTIPKKFDYITSAVFPDFEVKNAVTVDIAAPALIGNLKTAPIKYAIDHHAKNSVECEKKFLKSTKGACGEIIFEFAVFCDVEFDEYLAKCLHTAISTDTGCFKYESVTKNTFLAAAYLSDFISQETMARLNCIHFDTKSLNQMKMEKYALDNIHLYYGATLGICTITDEIKTLFGATDEDLEGISQLPRQIDTVESSISIKQKDENSYKISMRTKEYVDAALFCSNFGGGGHKRAAGCAINGSAEEVEKKIVDIYKEKIIKRSRKENT